MSHLDQKTLLPKGMQTDAIELVGGIVVIQARLAGATSVCPQCSRVSNRLHGRYQRCLADLPAHGRTVRINLSVRRYRCLTPWCRTKTFSENLVVDVVQPHARRTARLQELVCQLGLALGGRPTQALASRQLFPVNKDTFCVASARHNER